MSPPCPNCGAENQPGSRFCGSCGFGLSDAVPVPTEGQTRPSAERRFITALFADLVGFTSMTESSDAEDVRSMLTVYFERARAVIERFGGEVDKFIGDAITAFWGTTVANEDDAERAVRAGLELVDVVAALADELGVELSVRVGLLSGETAVGEGGNQHGLVIGDIVNTAARIQSAAQPDTVYVGESTQRLTADAFVYRVVDAIDAKGKSEPVAVWEAAAVVGQRGGGGRWATIEPPFVGRGDELRFLKDQVHATSRDQSARLVSIVGEPGIGKSRISWELVKYLDGVTEVFKWHQGRSPAYGEGVTFWALAEMVRSRAGITDEDQPNAARTKLRTAVAEFVGDEEEIEWLEPKLAGLLGLEDMAGVNRGELFSAIRTFFQRIASRDSVIMLFEDLHWADAGQLEFIEELVDLSPTSPILVVTLARPDLLDRRPGWGSGRGGFSSLHLGPLSSGEMGRLVRGVVPAADGEFVGSVVDRAGGVPLYAVEFLRALVDSGSLAPADDGFSPVGEIADVALPDSLHAVVGSRLDRLSPEDRALLQDCAILGQAFTEEGLSVLTGASADDLRPRLRELSRRELVRLEHDPLSPERGQYQFVQGVIREVAYGRIAKADRVARHVQVAEYFESVAPVEAAAVVADHYLKAYEIEPDDALARRARSSLQAAAERAIGLGSYAQALVVSEQALRVPGSDEDRLAVWALASKAASATLQHERAVELAREAVVWAEGHGSDSQRWMATHVLGLALIEADVPGEAFAVLSPAFDAEKANDPQMALLGSVLANAAMRDAKWQEAADVAVPVMVAAERAGDMVTLLEAMTSRGTSLPQLGRFHEGVALLRESTRLAGDSWSGLRAQNNLLLYSSSDGYMPVEEEGRSAFELSRRVGHAALEMRLMTWVAVFDEYSGSFDEAVAEIDSVDTADGAYWEYSTASIRERILWRASGDPSHLAEARRLTEPLLEAPEPQYRDWSRDFLSYAAWLEGDLAAASAYALGLEEVLESGIPPAVFQYRHTALAVAARRRDPAAVETASAMSFDPGGRRDSFAALSDLIRDVLAGAEVTVERIRSVLADVERADGPLGASEWRAELALLLGRGTLADQLAEEAHDWFVSVGDLGSLSRFEELFAAIATAEATG